MIFGTTPSQTVGPYLAIGLPFDDGARVVPDGAPGQIRIVGTVDDGNGDPIPDNLIETWQADGDGRFADLHDHGGSSGTRPGLTITISKLPSPSSKPTRAKPRKHLLRRRARRERRGPGPQPCSRAAT